MIRLCLVDDQQIELRQQIDRHGQPHILDFGMASTACDGIVSHETA